MITVNGGYAKLISTNIEYSDNKESVDFTMYAQIHYAHDKAKSELLEKLNRKGFVSNSSSNDRVKVTLTINPFSDDLANFMKSLEDGFAQVPNWLDSYEDSSISTSDNPFY